MANTLHEIHRGLVYDGWPSSCATAVVSTLCCTAVAVTAANVGLAIFTGMQVDTRIVDDCRHLYLKPNATSHVDFKWCKGWAKLGGLGAGALSFLLGAALVLATTAAVGVGVTYCVRRVTKHRRGYHGLV